MRGSVIVMRPAEYADWLEGGEELPPATAGQELFTRHRCDTCHNESSQARGPSLANLFGQTVRLADGRQVVADEAYIRESIMNPAANVVAGYQPLMPTFANQLSEEQVFHLIEYVKSLSGAPAGAEQTAPTEQPAPQSQPFSPQPPTSSDSSGQNPRRTSE
jgi:cytochrome c oxidase subunit 2